MGRTDILRVSISAFVISKENVSTIEALSQHRALSRSRVKVTEGGIAAAIKFLAENDTSQVLIIEASETGDALFAILEQLAGVCSPDSKVILIGAENDIEFYRKLIEMGLSDYFYDTVTPDQIVTVIQSFFSDTESANLGQLITFIGSRGGTGSSTVALNTAYTLGKLFNDDVILVDLDLSFGTAALTANLQQRQSVVDALSQPNRLDDVLISRFMLKYDDNLSIIPSPSTLGANYGVQTDAFNKMQKILRQMASFVVLDLPHQWLPWISEVLSESSEVVITAYPDLANLRDMKNFVDALGSIRGSAASPRLIFNRVGASRSELTSKDFEGALKIPVDASIAYDPGIFGAALNNGEMVEQTNSNCKAIAQFRKLANTISGRAPVAPPKRTGLARLFKSTSK